MVELEATHITNTREGAANRLACDVHPGILVIDRMGIHSAQTTGRLVDPLLAGSGRTFLVHEDTLKETTHRYNSVHESYRREGRMWPPREWFDHNNR